MQKRLLALLLAVAIIVTLMPSLLLHTEAAEYSQAILAINWGNIQSVGHQAPKGQACACYGLAYCRTILDGKVHYYSEYSSGTNEYNAYCSWWLGQYNGFFPSDKSDAYRRIYSEISAGRPVVVKVKGVRSSHHYVTIVGFENVASDASLSASNFLIIDPCASSFVAENLAAVGYDLKIEDGVYQVEYDTSGAVAPFESVKSFCDHKSYTGCGICKDCGKKYEYTLNYMDAGIYTVTNSFVPRKDEPYDSAQADETTTIKKGTVTVTASLTNAYKNKWYQISYQTGGKEQTGYVYSSYLKLNKALAQEYEVSITSPGRIVPRAALPVSGTVTSKHYPLDSVQAYLDGSLYATWTASDSTTMSMQLQPTDINWKLDFAAQAVGKHTLTLKAKDKKHSAYVNVIDHVFYTETDSAPTQYYTVTFNANGGSCSTSSVSVEDGNEIGSLPTPTRTGYQFKGWYTDAEGGTRVYASTIVSGNRTVYAQWMPIYYTVEFVGRTPKGAIIDLWKEPTSVPHGGTLKQSDFPIFLCSGVTLTGWYTDPTGGTQITTDTPITSNMTLYPHWQGDTITVSFDANGGEVAVKNKQVVYGEAYGELPVPIRSGYSFTGWLYTRLDRYMVDSNSTVEDSLDHKLQATWTKTVYKVEGGVIYFDHTTGLITGADQKITAAVIPEEIEGTPVIGIGPKAFSSCQDLAKIVLPDTLKSIAAEAFRGCSSLTEIVIPASVTEIGKDAFRACYSLKAIHVDESNPVYASEDGVLMNKGKTILIYCPAEKVSGYARYSIPEGVLRIQEQALYDCTEMGSLFIPASVTSIEEDALPGCSVEVSAENANYSSINGVLFNYDQTKLLYYPRRYTGAYHVPDGVEVIGASAFKWGKLTTVVLPDSLIRIEDYAFAYSSKMKSITIPQNVVSIGDYAFEPYIYSSYSGISEVYFEGAAPVLGEYAFGISKGEQKLAMLYYRDWMQGWNAPSYEGYPTQVYESRYAVGDGYLYYSPIRGQIVGCDENLTKVTIPARIGEVEIVSISETAFQNHAKLEQLTIPVTVTAIPDEAFAGSALQEIVYEGTMQEWLSINESNGFHCAERILIQCTDGTIPSDAVYAGTCGDDLRWFYLEDGTLHIEGSGAMQDYATSSDNSAEYPPWEFLYSEITAVVFSGNITYIGQAAFQWNRRITSVSLPDSCVEIGRSAFEGCVNLASIRFPDSVEIIGYRSFAGCKALTSLEIQKTAKEIRVGAFEGCSNLQKIILPAAPRLRYACFFNIAPNAEVLFDGTSAQWSQTAKCAPESCVNNDTIIHCSNRDLDISIQAMGLCGETVEWFLNSEGTLQITGEGPMVSTCQFTSDSRTDVTCSWYGLGTRIKEVVIDEGVTSISRNAFTDCGRIISIEIPKSIKVIESRAFYFCTNLTSVTFPNAEIELEDEVFLLCTKLATVTIPYGLTKIGVRAFSNCGKITTISLPESVTSIGDEAFYGCEGLNQVELPDSLETIGERAFAQSALESLHIPKGVKVMERTFDGCDTLKEITVDSENCTFFAADGVLYNKDTMTLVLAPHRYATDHLIVPEGVVAVAAEALANCRSISEITLPTTLEEVGSKAFAGCEWLHYVNFSGGPPRIAQDAFTNVTANATYPPDDGRWTEADMQNYGGELQWEPYYVFIAEGTCGENLFWKLDSRGRMRIWGTGEMKRYNEGETPWFSYRNSIRSVVFEEGVETVSRFAFCNCIYLSEICLPESLISIGWSAFYGTNIETLNLPANLRTLDADAFGYCLRLKSVTIPSGSLQQEKYVTNYPFRFCSSLQEIHFLGDALEKPKELVKYFSPSESDYIYLKVSMYYPTGNVTWTQELIEKNLHENITWVPVEENGNPRTDSLSWYFIPEEGRFVVWGTGEMENYSASTPAPWHKYADAIKNVTISKGVTSVGNYAFYNCASLENAVLCENVQKVGSHAFDGCTALQKISFSGDAPVISENAFTRVTATGYYTDGNATWTSEKTKNYGGTITWHGGQIFGDSIFWSLNDAGELRVWGIGEMPDGSNTTVWQYYAPWYEKRDSIRTLLIEEGITYISSMAFSGCENLKSVTIPSTLTELGRMAFVSCSAIDSIYISDLRAWCAIRLRCDMEDLYDRYDEYQISRIYEEAYPHIREYRIYYGIIYLNSVPLNEIEIPEGIEEIRPFAFTQCSATKVTIPDSVQVIRDYAFNECPLLEKVDLGSGVTELGLGAFSHCYNLKNISLPISLSTIGTSALASSGLTTVTIPDSVVSIGSYAFWCSDLTEIVIGAGVQKIGEFAFSGCDDLKSIVVKEGNTAFFADSRGVLYDAGQANLIHCPEQLQGEYLIPETVTNIEDEAFTYCMGINRIAFRGSAPTIGKGSFRGVSAKVYYPGDNATWTEDVQKNYGGALEWIAFDLAGYEDAAFGFCGEELNWILTSDGELVIRGTGKMDSYPNAEDVPWAQYRAEIKKVTLPDGVTNIGQNAFFCCENLTTIALPASVSEIESFAFDGCTALSAATYEGGINQWNAVAIAEGNTALQNVIALSCAHANKNEVAAKAPDCLCTGNNQYYTCIDCGMVFKADGVTETTVEAETLSALGHDMVTDPAVPATCEATGLTEGSHCSRCDYRVEQKETPIAPNNHVGPSHYDHDGQHHWMVCDACGGKSSAEDEHSYGEDHVCAVCGYLRGFAVSGTVESFLDENGSVTLSLINGGEVKYTTSVTGNTTHYCFDAVAPATYTLRVEKAGHVMRTYVITVTDTGVEQDAKICPYGDIDGDGETGMLDMIRLYNHINETEELTDYAYLCADVDGDGEVGMLDMIRLYGHINETEPLY